MFIPDVINTLLMGLIFMVIIVTVVRPFVMHIVDGAMVTEDMHKEAIEEVQQEMIRVSLLAEAQRNDQIRFQQLLLELPEKPKHKPVPEIDFEAEDAKAKEAVEAEAQALADAAAAVDARGRPGGAGDLRGGAREDREDRVAAVHLASAWGKRRGRGAISFETAGRRGHFGVNCRWCKRGHSGV